MIMILEKTGICFKKWSYNGKGVPPLLINLIILQLTLLQRLLVLLLYTNKRTDYVKVKEDHVGL